MDTQILQYNNNIHRKHVIALWQNAFGYEAVHNHPETVLDAKLAVADSLLFVAIQQHEVVGTIMVGYDGHRGWLYSVAVASHCRKQGIGSKLVEHAEFILQSLGCMKINLQVVFDNENAVDFYRKLGYEVEKRISMGKRMVL